MKMKMIQSLNLGKLNHEEILEFCKKICGLMGSVESETAKKASQALNTATDEFSTALDDSPEMISLEIQAKDSDVDQAWRGMNNELENHLDHPNPKVRQAAATIYEVWTKYADPTELPYEEEYKALKSIIALISKVPADVMKDAGVDEWFDALKARNDAFVGLWGTENVSDTQRMANQVKKSRAALEEKYGDFVSFMDGWSKYAEIDEKFNDIDAEVAAVVAKINDVVAEYNNMLTERRKNVSKCIEDILADLMA